MRTKLIPLLLLVPLLSACEQMAELLELPNPQKVAALAEAEGKAVGGACRQGGRSLEDCYALNAGAQKAAVFAGWREMNDYMLQNNMEVVPSQLPRPGEVAPQSLAPVAAADAAKAPDAPAAEDARPSRRSRATPSPTTH